MDKRYLHHLWTRLRPIKTWYFAAAFIVCAPVCVAALRANYTHMTQLRQAVYEADKHNTNTEATLRNLRAYMGAHMNTGLETDNGVYPPVQLKHTYARLVKAEADRVNAVNSQVYTDAQRQCEAQYPSSFSGGPRVPCIEAYVKSHGTSVHTIPDALYKFDFVSPKWSPDIAGWSLIACILLGILGPIRWLAGLWLQDVTS